MHKPWLPAFALLAYSALVIKLLVFKIELLRIGHLRFRFAPHIGEPNYVPFKSILFSLRGEPSWSIAILNLVGNVVLLVPFGLLLPFVFRNLPWPASVALGIAFGLAIEALEVGFHLGIFDIDDVILNSLGVVIGYWASRALVSRGRPRLRPS
jgi:glycopeptide antibiotics resistance protein